MPNNRLYYKSIQIRSPSTEVQDSQRSSSINVYNRLRTKNEYIFRIGLDPEQLIEN